MHLSSKLLENVRHRLQRSDGGGHDIFNSRNLADNKAVSAVKGDSCEYLGWYIVRERRWEVKIMPQIKNGDLGALVMQDAKSILISLHCQESWALNSENLLDLTGINSKKHSIKRKDS